MEQSHDGSPTDRGVSRGGSFIYCLECTPRGVVLKAMVRLDGSRTCVCNCLGPCCAQRACESEWLHCGQACSHSPIHTRVRWDLLALQIRQHDQEVGTQAWHAVN